MRRRTYLSAVGASMAVLAGCTGRLLGGDGGGGDGDGGDGDGGDGGAPEGEPEATVEAYIEAIDAGNTNQANDLIHSESPEGERSEGRVPSAETYDYTVEETEVLEESEDEARVRAEVVVEDDGETSVVERVYELRPEDGKWRIWEISS